LLRHALGEFAQNVAGDVDQLGVGVGTIDLAISVDREGNGLTERYCSV
jgi:hypothetical protein